MEEQLVGLHNACISGLCECHGAQRSIDYGLVFRMQVDLLVAPTQYRNNVKGEWRALATSNILLSAYLTPLPSWWTTDTHRLIQAIVSAPATAHT